MIVNIIAFILAIAANVCAVELWSQYPVIEKWLPFLDGAVYLIGITLLAVCIVRVVKAIRK